MSEETQDKIQKELAQFKTPDEKLDYLLAMTHYNYKDGCDAWVAMTKLWPEVRTTLEECRAECDWLSNHNSETLEVKKALARQLAESQAREQQLREALEWYGRGGFDRGCTPVGENEGLASRYWQDQGKRARAALAAVARVREGK